MIAAFTGLFAGIMHVFSGPDHLAAVAPLSIEHGRNSWSIGLRWGIGHSAGVIILGLLLVLLHEVLPLEGISSWSERLVGVVLIGIGIWGVKKALSNQVHIHAHQHDGHDHAHIHVHGAQTSHASGQSTSHQHSHTVMGVGMLHGLAGGSHLLGMLPALAFPTQFQRIAYLSAYALGTVVAMSSFSTIIGWIASRCALGGNKAYRALMLSCSAAAMVLGGYWLMGPVGS